MNFNKLEEISFSKSDIGYSKLLHIPVGVYKYHDIEMYLVPLTMKNYKDPLFSANDSVEYIINKVSHVHPDAVPTLFMCTVMDYYKRQLK